MTTIKKNKKENEKHDSQTTAVRISSEVAKLLKEETLKLNKQKKGSKKISLSDVLEVSVSLLDDEQREQLLAQTVTSEDRQKVAYSQYSKKHKGVSRSDFLELIQYGEVKIDDYLPEAMKRQKITNNVNKLEIA